jgi:3-oxoacyl-[acyl-carrier protein] reductase
VTNVQQDGRVALITGASGAIGAAVARLLASRGMRIVANYRSNRDKADDLVASIGSAGGQAMAAQADVRDRSAVVGILEQARAAMGEVEVLVHSALMPYAIKSFEEMSVDELSGKVEQEIRAASVVTKAVVPGMTKHGYGRIVYLGTVESALPLEGMIALGTSKAALSSFTRFVARNWGHVGSPSTWWPRGPWAVTCTVPPSSTIRTTSSAWRPRRRWAGSPPPTTWPGPSPSTPVTTANSPPAPPRRSMAEWPWTDPSWKSSMPRSSGRAG